MELQSYRVLDPPCGSGNFLYIAYQELERPSRKYYSIKLASQTQKYKRANSNQFCHTTAILWNGYKSICSRMARVTLMIGWKEFQSII